MVRPGLALYGVSPSEEKLDFPLEPILSLRTSITFLKRVPPERPLGYTRTFVTREESVIATIPVGYGDGLRRQLSNKGRVIIRGHYAPMVGNISMDSTLVDVSGVPDVGLGDEVTIVGSQGGLSITLEDIAKATDTIAYEVTCLIGTRIPRVYLG
jgi:alanine racemase